MAAPPAATVGDIPRLFRAMDRWLEANTTFESTEACEAARAGIAAASSLTAAALVPLRERLFGYDAAASWGYFVTLASARILSEDGVAFPPFDHGAYLLAAVETYDLAVDTAVWDLCVDDDDDSDAEASEAEASDADD